MIIEQLQNPNYKDRHREVNGIVIHSMSEYIDGKFANDFLAGIGLSAHYLISPKGEVYECVDPDFAAYHAGVSEWEGQKYLNTSYIGVEVLVEGDNSYAEFLDKINQSEAFKAIQYTSCRWLIGWLKMQYPKITDKRIVRHSDVSGPSIRPDDPKFDPGKGFNFRSIISSDNFVTKKPTIQ